MNKNKKVYVVKLEHKIIGVFTSKLLAEKIYRYQSILDLPSIESYKLNKEYDINQFLDEHFIKRNRKGEI